MSELDDYDYELPRSLIAQEPLANRADARLLVINRAEDSITHSYVRDLPQLSRSGDLLVLNDTRVVPARLVGYRTLTGGHWEGLFLRLDEQGLWRLLGPLARQDGLRRDDHSRQCGGSGRHSIAAGRAAGRRHLGDAR